MLTRRTLLLGGGGLVVVGCGPTGDDGRPSVTTATNVPDVAVGPVVRGRFTSRARLGAVARWVLIRPPDVDGPLPLVVALHGHGGTAEQLLGPDWGLPQYLASAVAAGVAPFAIAAVDGGRSFWHERPTGEDAGAMVTDELLPLLLERADVAVRPIGLLGWSMGGYGVLHLAPTLGADKVAAVVASSPGLYTDPALAHPNGFVDAAEYEEFSVMGRQADLAGIPVRVDCGTSDPFYEASRTYVDGFPEGAEVVSDFGDGGHEYPYSRRMLPAELAFLGEHVAGVGSTS